MLFCKLPKTNASEEFLLDGVGLGERAREKNFRRLGTTQRTGTAPSAHVHAVARNGTAGKALNLSCSGLSRDNNTNSTHSAITIRDAVHLYLASICSCNTSWVYATLSDPEQRNSVAVEHLLHFVHLQPGQHGPV